ncbi:ankyrin repeat and protein kinase domain-containing protein 1-like [Mercenaria mercenaria]|uniref:ankyrin repeat and protein kinase domain-containing protein 1-like n=1 Tax=Mercenaria mercenaria TaxID=6596 RepID=UPI00234EB02F|nr:ankyrin repeat and protein kinase domain-containing protein 1-like [Mercenaria mercenaria]
MAAKKGAPDLSEEGIEMKTLKSTDSSVQEIEKKSTDGSVQKLAYSMARKKHPKSGVSTDGNVEKKEEENKHSTSHKQTPAQSSETVPKGYMDYSLQILQTPAQSSETVPKGYMDYSLQILDFAYRSTLEEDSPIKERLLVFKEDFEDYVKHIPQHQLEDIYKVYDRSESHLLHYFVIGKSIELVTSILKNNPQDAKEKDRKGRSPLHIAALLNYSDIATELINKHAEINLKDDNDMTPLLFAANYGSGNVFKILLLNCDTTVDVTDKKGKSVLHLATASNNINIIKHFIEEDICFFIYLESLIVETQSDLRLKEMQLKIEFQLEEKQLEMERERERKKREREGERERKRKRSKREGDRNKKNECNMNLK